MKSIARSSALPHKGGVSRRGFILGARLLIPAAAMLGVMLGAIFGVIGQVHAQPATSAPTSNAKKVTASVATNAAQAPANTAKPTPTNLATSESLAQAQKQATAARHAIIAYLGQLISWYRHLDVEQRLATEPAETLYIADDREMARDILKLGFDYAHAEADLLKQEYGNTAVSSSGGTQATENQPPNAASPILGVADLIARRNQAQNDAAAAQARLDNLQKEAARATGKARDRLSQQIVAAQGQLQLAQSRVESLNAMIDFETGADNNGKQVSGFAAQIDELRNSVMAPAGSKTTAPRTLAPSEAAPPATGIIGLAERIIALNQKSQTLLDTADQTNQMLAAADNLRKPLLDQLTELNRQALAISANAASTNIDTIRQSKAAVENLTARHKLLLAALLPLSKQMVTLRLYSANLERWRSSVQREINRGLRQLAVRLGGLLVLFLAIFLGALVWRRLTFRYVQDVQRRYQLLQIRRIIVVLVIALILLFDFANELGALATIMGFAAAGIALALQNVILSLAGYFYLSGRFGIRIGDRVEISGIDGDVLEIGMFKMTLMELNKADKSHQPTGRVVVFPNSVVFQTNGNFFKQLPGSNFTWNELRLTLAPDCDYRVAEKRLGEVVTSVFARYRDAIQRDYRGIERDLNIRIDTPRPQTRLRFGDSGIELVLRYPVDIHAAAQTSDEISRRLIDAIAREPALKLVPSAAPLLQPANPPAPNHEGNRSGRETHDSSEPQPPNALDSSKAANAAAAEVGLETANAVVRTGQAEEAAAAPLPPGDKSKSNS